MQDLFNLRQVYISELIKLAASNHKIVSLDSDSKEATMADQFAATYPERAFGFGIAEQDMLSAAGGMATMGLIPFVNSYAMFIVMRALDQLRHSIAYPNVNVKLFLSHHGLDVGSDGVTHQLTEDVAILRAIPNVKLLHPADAIEMVQMVNYAVEINGPIVVKTGKSKVPSIHPADYQWEYGKPSCVISGARCAVITQGVMLHRALNACQTIEQKYGFIPSLINMSSLTDIDITLFLDMLGDSEYVITLEDHSVFGGLGGMVAEILSEHHPLPLKRIGLDRRFAECGAPELLFHKYHMDEFALISEIEKYFEL